MLYEPFLFDQVRVIGERVMSGRDPGKRDVGPLRAGKARQPGPQQMRVGVELLGEPALVGFQLVGFPSQPATRLDQTARRFDERRSRL